MLRHAKSPFRNERMQGSSSVGHFSYETWTVDRGQPAAKRRGGSEGPFC